MSGLCPARLHRPWLVGPSLPESLVSTPRGEAADSTTHPYWQSTWRWPRPSGSHVRYTSHPRRWLAESLFFSACRGEILPRKVWVATCPPWSICVTAVRRVERQCCASLLRRPVRLDIRAIDCARWPTRDRRPECSEELRNNVANRSPLASQPNTPPLGARAECRQER